MSKTPKSEKKDKKDKTPKKDKEKTPKKASTPGGEGSDSGDGELRAVCAIATPLADLNTTKKILKVVKKAAKAKQVRRGVKEVVKALKKETKGVCVIAGDISPIDVITHVPILCEEANVPYVYVHSKEELGAAGMTKRPTSVMLVLPEGTKGSVKMSSDDKKEFDDMYSKIVSKVKSMSK